MKKLTKLKVDKSPGPDRMHPHVLLRLQKELVKAPLHDTIRPHGACRLPCTWVNRNV